MLVKIYPIANLFKTFFTSHVSLYLFIIVLERYTYVPTSPIEHVCIASICWVCNTAEHDTPQVKIDKYSLEEPLVK